MGPVCASIGGALAVALAAGTAPPDQGARPAVDDSYYMVIFSEQPHGGANPWVSHTFATFIRAGSTGAGRRTALEVHTISWLAATGNIRLFRTAEPGRNFSLRYSLERALAPGLRISRWGPYRIEPELYHRALIQIDRLESGQVLWKALDRDQRLCAFNCFHAIADLDSDRGLLRTGCAWGDHATWLVVQHLTRWIIEPEPDESVWSLLGLDDYPIVPRPLMMGSGAWSVEREY